MKHKIENGIDMPRPSGGRGKASKWVFEEMKVGQSFFHPIENMKDKTPEWTRIHNMRMYYQRKLGTKYAIRTVDEDGVIGYRVWRME